MIYPVEKYKIYNGRKHFDDGSKDGIYLPQIVAVSTYAGRVVRGVATCDPKDIENFNFEKGRKLAVTRCAAKIAKKRIKRAARKLNEAAAALDAAKAHYVNMEAYYNEASIDEATLENELSCLAKEM